MGTLKKLYDRIFSTTSAGIYLLLFAFSIGAATFVENDFGTSSAQKVIFKSWWFELLLFLFACTLVANIIRFKMVRQKKWATLTFHAAMVIILIGAGVTRYFGSEGMMHIREGSASNSFLTAESYLQVEATIKGTKYVFDEPALFATLGNNHFERSYILGDQKVKVEVLDFMPNPKENMVDDDNGVPVIKIVIAGANGREEYFVKRGDISRIQGTLFNFGTPEEPAAFNISYENDSLYFKAPTTFSQMRMATQQKDTIPAGVRSPLFLRSMYASGSQSFVFGDFSPHARVEIASSSPKMASSSTGGLKVKISSNGEEQETLVYGSKGTEGSPSVLALANGSYAVSYGAKRVFLPFKIQLNDFIMERYPGTENASSYASEVTLVDPENNVNKDQRIYMNHILDYNGYRFFQSSYDQDELGSYLSVNHDALGTWISYVGYILLTLGMIFTLLSKKSRFQQLGENIRRMRQAEKILSSILVALLMSLATPAICAPPVATPLKVASTQHAKLFGTLLIQDYKGRLKPMDTYTNEILRKLSRKETLYGMNAEQIVLGMAAYPADWYNVPLVKIGKHEEIKKILQVDGPLASYEDFFNERGEYKLKDQVRAAYNTPKGDLGVLEKELMKIDEKVNICNMVFSGSFMRVFPVPGDKSYQWLSPEDMNQQHNTAAAKGGAFIEKFYPAYIPTLQNAIATNDWGLANQLVAELDRYQHENGGEILPGKARLNAELLLNKLNVFNNLTMVYGLMGLVFLTMLFTSVFKPRLNLALPFKIAFGILAAGFLFHTTGLGLRWYISGRAPWSNGYESMIYIAWTTMLAGLIFSRKSMGGLTATSVLASTILMVAGMSWLDPEITPLVPVLKSYWLTIHVSMEAGSYGFLMLGAIIGVLNLLLMVVASQKNSAKIYRIIKEMTFISEMTLIGGLFMVSIGTYLGGVWANESWGRYWGWDAKETWALVTILVYSFILHMRFIPGLRGQFAFNVASLFGWATVLMTYFGVNYYLSGLHSYAAGDPVPVPPFVYYAVAILTTLSLAAYWKYRQYLKQGNSI
ncbi:MAG: cytochrome C biogenesis protein [Saprospiraceae bacterium]|nr:MAG: cytochrome C biogenesis protein [Saprospiraceae bacterium]